MKGKTIDFRREGYIQPLKTSRFPRRMIFWDTETTSPQKGAGRGQFELILGAAVYLELDASGAQIKRLEHFYRTSEEFIEWVYSVLPKRGSITLFAHNTGFDVRVLDLCYEFDKRGWTSEPPIINERTFIWKVKTPRGSLTFLDTANLGVISVGELGQDLGFPKGIIDFNTCTTEELESYCLLDVLIIERFVSLYLSYLKENNLGGFKTTLAGQSMASFRTRFLDSPPYVHLNTECLKMERDAYHGGRVECRKIGHFTGEEYYYLDVNSMYPYAMTSEPLPIKLVGFGHNVRLSYMPIRLKMYYCIATCEIETNEAVYGILKDSKLVFPVGSFTATLCQPELLYGIDKGHIKKVISCAVYETGYPFNAYVDFFYKAKQEYSEQGNKSYRYISKLFLNSLYGKFGQLKPIRDKVATIPYKDVYRLPMVDDATGRHYQEICWYGDIFEESKEGETTLSCPALAAAITAKARMTLYNFMVKAGLENVFYCDTDSIITNRKGYEALASDLSESELGKLKLEKVAKALHIYGNKDYIFGREAKKKGVPSKATPVSKGKWEYLQFQGFISWLNDGAKGAPTGSYMFKERRSAYNKGVVDAEGNVTPFLLALPAPHQPVSPKAFLTESGDSGLIPRLSSLLPK